MFNSGLFSFNLRIPSSKEENLQDYDEYDDFEYENEEEKESNKEQKEEEERQCATNSLLSKKLFIFFL